MHIKNKIPNSTTMFPKDHSCIHKNLDVPTLLVLMKITEILIS